MLYKRIKHGYENIESYIVYDTNVSNIFVTKVSIKENTCPLHYFSYTFPKNNLRGPEKSIPSFKLSKYERIHLKFGKYLSKLKYSASCYFYWELWKLASS